MNGRSQADDLVEAVDQVLEIASLVGSVGIDFRVEWALDRLREKRFAWGEVLLNEEADDGPVRS